MTRELVERLSAIVQRLEAQSDLPTEVAASIRYLPAALTNFAAEYSDDKARRVYAGMLLNLVAKILEGSGYADAAKQVSAAKKALK